MVTQRLVVTPQVWQMRIPVAPDRFFWGSSVSYHGPYSRKAKLVTQQVPLEMHAVYIGHGRDRFT